MICQDASETPIRPYDSCFERFCPVRHRTPRHLRGCEVSAARRRALPIPGNLAFGAAAAAAGHRWMGLPGRAARAEDGDRPAARPDERQRVAAADAGGCP